MAFEMSTELEAAVSVAVAAERARLLDAFRELHGECLNLPEAERDSHCAACIVAFALEEVGLLVYRDQLD